jgi:flagellar protein FliS
MAMTNNLYSQYQKNKINIISNQNETEVIATSNQAINKNNAYQQYQNNMVKTASPQELTLMLYNGLIKFLNLAKQGIEEKSIEKANNNILRAQDIVLEFMSTLDMKYEVSKGLMALYDYMNRRLIDANLKKDKAIVEEVLMFAEQLRDTWMQAMKLAKQQAVNK